MTDARERDDQPTDAEEATARAAAQERVDAGETPDNAVAPDESAPEAPNTSHPL